MSATACSCAGLLSCSGVAMTKVCVEVQVEAPDEYGRAGTGGVGNGSRWVRGCCDASRALGSDDIVNIFSSY